MAGVPHDYSRPLKQLTWPQDTLTPPHGYGAMPAVDILNSKAVKREYFTYSALFSTVSWNVDAIQTVTLDKDGDFWLSSMIIQPFFSVTNTPVEIFMDFTLQDNLTQYRMFNPSIPTEMLMNFYINEPANQNKFITNIIQPYCFLRGNSITMQLLSRGAAPIGATFDVYVALHGWKEYAHAAV